MIELAEHARGVVLPVRAQASARKSEIRGVHQGRLRVSVTRPFRRESTPSSSSDVVTSSTNRGLPSALFAIRSRTGASRSFVPSTEPTMSETELAPSGCTGTRMW